MSNRSSKQSKSKLYIYKGHAGGRFLFERILNKSEEETNRFTYMGTFDEVVAKLPKPVVQSPRTHEETEIENQEE